MKLTEAQIDAIEIVVEAKRLARKDFIAHLKAQGRRISLEPLPVAKLHIEWLNSHGSKFYDLAREKIAKSRGNVSPDRRPTGPRIRATDGPKISAEAG